MAETVRYRGNVPLRHFLGWVLLVLLGVGAVGLLTAQLLVSQRQNQLVEETAARVGLQGQGHARLVQEWIQGIENIGNNLANAQLVRLFVADAARKEGAANGQPAVPNEGQGADSGMQAALMAQTPYMQQALTDFVQRNRLDAAQLLTADGKVVLGQGMEQDAQPILAKADMEKVARTRSSLIMPLRLNHDAVVMDILEPIMQVGEVGEGAVAGGPVVGMLWFSLPVGDRLADLLALTPLDRPGERSALIQGDGSSAAVVGRTALAPMGSAFEDFRQSLASGRALSLSAIDGKATFATMQPVTGTPFYVLQEYRANEALALMNLYKPGLYTIVLLGVVVLAAFMLAMTVHLMAQRNKTRVKLLGQTMDALVRAVEARDPHLAGHHARVARLTIAVSNRMNLPVGERATLFYAAQLSAVGRLLVPKDVLGKSGKLSPAERAALEAEIAKAHGVLSDLDFDLPIVPVIGQMYERVDGSGYPGGLKGEAISRMARVLGAVDAYVALTSDRSFRKAMTPTGAQKVLLDGGKFDADVVGALKGLR